MKKDINKKISLKRSILYGFIAAIIYFCIAFFANTGHELGQRITSALGHAFLCMCMTFVSTSMMEFTFNSFKKPFNKYFGCLLFSGLISATIMISGHLILGTPEIFKTLIASGVTSVPYYLLFPLQLLFENDKKVNRFKYREDENWDRVWKVKTFSSPYYLKDLFKVFWLNLYRVSKKNPTNIQSIDKVFKFEDNIETKYKICFLGDLMPMYKYDWQIDSSLEDFFHDIDYLVCNFEGLIGLDGFGGILGMSHNHKILDRLEKLLPAKKIILSVANNHAADYGIESFNKCISVLEERGFNVVGKRDKPSFIIDDSINIVAATQWSNQPHGYLSFLENSHNYQKDGLLNILYPHWGYELEYYPRKEDVEAAKRLCDLWDVIIGHHSHVPGPVVSYNNKLVAYSLGDSSTAMPRRRYRMGAIVQIEIGRNDFGELKVKGGRWANTKLIKHQKSYLLTKN